MADEPVEMKTTLGLTGLTMNAMALIAPGAFLWLTFAGQAAAGATAPAMWIGIVFATALCLATAVCYAEMAKLYPGTGSSYYFAEQSFLNHEKAWPYARLAKFIVGWGSHLYYWIYPGVMVGVIGVISGYLVGTLWPNFMSASNPGPMFMMAVAIVFSFAVAYIAHRGVNGSTSVNIAINVIQISALIVFAVVALGYRMNHPPGSVALQFDPQTSAAYSCEFATTKTMVNGHATDTIVRAADGTPQCRAGRRRKAGALSTSAIRRRIPAALLSRIPTAASVVRMHNFGWMFVQATIAILILVGFESVTSMGGEAKNAKRDVPIAVITSLLVQGCFCYLFEYFAANYFLNSGYPHGERGGLGGAHRRHDDHGRRRFVRRRARAHLHAGRSRHGVSGADRHHALLYQHRGARDLRHGQRQGTAGLHGSLALANLTPHHAIWTLAIISAVVGCITVVVFFGDGAAPSDASIAALPHGFWSSFGYTTHDKMAALPNTFLTTTLASNFGTFLLYMLSCITCIVCYHNHPKFKVVRHLVIPVFGLLANLACMAFYVIGPFMGYGTKMEPLLALGVALVWGVYGGIYFTRASRKMGKTTLVEGRAPAA